MVALASADACHYAPRMSTRSVPAQIGDLPRIGRPATSALLAAGITSLDQVATLSHRELLALHGVGPKAVDLLVAALARTGRTLRE
jgi:predicted flap endonuclease-1-like 5' DNA nuclease